MLYANGCFHTRHSGAFAIASVSTCPTSPTHSWIYYCEYPAPLQIADGALVFDTFRRSLAPREMAFLFLAFSEGKVLQCLEVAVDFGNKSAHTRDWTSKMKKTRTSHQITPGHIICESFRDTLQRLDPAQGISVLLYPGYFISDMPSNISGQERPCPARYLQAFRYLSRLCSCD